MDTYNLENLPAVVALFLYGGDDFYCEVTLPQNITGDTFEAVIHAPDADESITITVLDAPGGRLSLTLTAAETLALKDVAESWKFKWTHAGVARTLMAGTCLVK
jgi:hypothetical protein